MIKYYDFYTTAKKKWTEHPKSNHDQEFLELLKQHIQLMEESKTLLFTKNHNLGCNESYLRSVFTIIALNEKRRVEIMLAKKLAE